jgi:hypothetical protein
MSAESRLQCGGEKLLNAHCGREPIGGAGYGKGLSKVNSLYPCRDLLPNDITILHWYYIFNPDYDKVYHKRGMKLVFGNLNALDVDKWDERVRRGAKGGFPRGHVYHDAQEIWRGLCV